VPLASRAPWVAALAGIALADAEVRVVAPGSPRPLARRRAPVLFTHQGVSGPAPMDVSRAVSGHPEPASLVLEIDLLPGAPDLDAWLRGEARSGGKRLVVTAVAERVARRLGEAAMDCAGVPRERKLSELSKAERTALVKALRGLPVPLAGTLGFEKAEVTAGGVALDGVDPRTMESRLVPGLFFAGEILDLDGWIGGYNFQAAFSTGWLAATSACETRDRQRIPH
jgi:predicted Rossmann fold flavoprotein